MSNENCITAIVEFGDCDKEGYVYIKGDVSSGEKVLAHTYWYPEDITNDEANQEVADLCEHYENVIIVLPIPAHVQFEVLTHE